jgi:hypothetical protein
MKHTCSDLAWDNGAEMVYATPVARAHTPSTTAAARKCIGCIADEALLFRSGMRQWSWNGIRKPIARAHTPSTTAAARKCVMRRGWSTLYPVWHEAVKLWQMYFPCISHALASYWAMFFAILLHNMLINQSTCPTWRHLQDLGTLLCKATADHTNSSVLNKNGGPGRMYTHAYTSAPPLPL